MLNCWDANQTPNKKLDAFKAKREKTAPTVNWAFEKCFVYDFEIPTKKFFLSDALCLFLHEFPATITTNGSIEKRGK